MSNLNIKNEIPAPVYKVTIRKQTIVLVIDRTDLVEVKETGDGMVFNLQGGLYFTLTDMRMPLEVKRTISTAINRFKNTNLDINLMNYISPVTVTQ